ncbi:PREDICTED: cytochrome P450 94A1-like [Lupinus angustifolius]|uniref:cytochrome P450 94A1-like n=1 Tax=Lupinus angustifolius TaxID=3871 RepID=UPI00092E394A|nr:PREDICTED: cytochrome P450 94A1-like [Lupinus angustifolius]
MAEFLVQLFTPFFFFLLPLLFFFFFTLQKKHKKVEALSSTTATTLPKAYPLIGSYLAFKANTNRRIQWLSDAVIASPNATFTFYRLPGQTSVVTANPATVQHILKTHFSNYQKGANFVTTLSDFLGAGIFNANGQNWKFQRQVASHEFNTRSLRKFVEQVVDAELNHRLIPILNESQSQSKTIDFQDILQRFTFDNICKIAFGFDPEYLTPSLKASNFAKAFEEANIISTKRFREPLPIVWKIKRKLNIGSEKRLRIAVSEVQEFARKIVREKKKELEEKASLDSVDMLSRFLSSGHSDEDFVMDIVISFILAGKDTTSAALTWFFWLLSKNPRVEKEIIKEIREKSEGVTVYEEVKDMVYTHAALSESMRLYPPVPMDGKEAMNNDVLPDGTIVKKGMSVTYHVYAMGRMESIWGSDWAQFRPERWLESVVESGSRKWSFVGKDSFTYPVFQAGPRICLGKEMAFLQMKRVVASVLNHFRVLPLVADPEFISYLTSQMKGGFPVKIQKRVD